MMSPDTITHLILVYRYPMLILLAFIEGPIVSFAAGFLSSLGYFNPALVMVILVGKDMTVDAACYAVGYWGNKGALVHRYSRKIGITEEHWNKVDELWKEHPWRTMFISKLSYGLSLPFLISAGLTRMSYKRFWFYAAQIAFLQYGVLVIVGYFFGNYFSFIKNTIDIIQYGAALLGVFIVAYYLFSTYMRRRTLREDSKL